MPLLQADANPGTASWTNDITGPTNFQERVTTTDGVSGGTVRVIGGRAFINTADSSAITNTNLPGNFDITYTIPADTLKANSVLKFRAVVRFTNTVGATTATLQAQLGGQGVVTSSAVDVANDDTAVLEGFITTRAAPGAAVDTVGGGTAWFSTGASGTFATASTLGDGVTLATNGALILAIQLTWSAADASSAFLESLYAEIL